MNEGALYVKLWKHLQDIYQNEECKKHNRILAMLFLMYLVKWQRIMTHSKTSIDIVYIKESWHIKNIPFNQF